MDESIDFVIPQGGDWSYAAFIQNDPVSRSAPLARPVNLRGCRAVMTAARSRGDSQRLFTLSSDDGSLVIDEKAGRVGWRMPAATTTLFTVPVPAPIAYVRATPVYLLGYYTMKIFGPSGSVIREFSGKLYLSPDV